jgi:hypothetical protein
MRRKNDIEAQCGSGQMTEEQYADLQKRQYIKDTKLLVYFKQAKDVKKAQIVFERLQIIKTECENLGIPLPTMTEQAQPQ